MPRVSSSGTLSSSITSGDVSSTTHSELSTTETATSAPSSFSGGAHDVPQVTNGSTPAISEANTNADNSSTKDVGKGSSAVSASESSVAPYSVSHSDLSSTVSISPTSVYPPSPSSLQSGQPHTSPTSPAEMPPSASPLSVSSGPVAPSNGAVSVTESYPSGGSSGIAAASPSPSSPTNSTPSGDPPHASTTHSPPPLPAPSPSTTPAATSHGTNATPSEVKNPQTDSNSSYTTATGSNVSLEATSKSQHEMPSGSLPSGSSLQTFSTGDRSMTSTALGDSPPSPVPTETTPQSAPASTASSAGNSNDNTLSSSLAASESGVTGSSSVPATETDPATSVASSTGDERTPTATALNSSTGSLSHTTIRSATNTPPPDNLGHPSTTLSYKTKVTVIHGSTFTVTKSRSSIRGAEPTTNGQPPGVEPGNGGSSHSRSDLAYILGPIIGFVVFLSVSYLFILRRRRRLRLHDQTQSWLIEAPPGLGGFTEKTDGYTDAPSRTAYRVQSQVPYTPNVVARRGIFESTSLLSPLQSRCTPVDGEFPGIHVEREFHVEGDPISTPSTAGGDTTMNPFWDPSDSGNSASSRIISSGEPDSRHSATAETGSLGGCSTKSSSTGGTSLVFARLRDSIATSPDADHSIDPFHDPDPASAVAGPTSTVESRLGPYLSAILHSTPGG